MSTDPDQTPEEATSRVPTQTSDDTSGTRAAAVPPEALALVVLWSPAESGRISDACIVPPSRPGAEFSFGRGSSDEKDGPRRLDFVRSRAGSVELRPRLASPRISRHQLRVRSRGIESLDVENIGRCPLRHNGERVDSAMVLPGDTLQLGQELLLLCVRRLAWVRSVGGEPEQMPFGAPDPCGLVGESPALWEFRRQISFLAPRPEHVLITGESGTGKELAARALHALSPRREGAFVARNAATFPEGLVDAELFGHARNYPNQGMPDRAGLIGEARGGTLFLDELAELPQPLQTHLLRVLDNGEYQRLGDATTRTSDFRLIAATNQPDLLREDLAARLKLSLRTPPLNERLEDVPLLVVHLLRTLGASNPDVRARVFPDGDLDREPRIAIEFIDSLVRRTYRTHLRELEAALWEALGAGGQGVVGERLSRAPAGPASPSRRPPSGVRGKAPTVDELRAALAENDWSAERTWRALGLSSRHALARLMAKYGVKRGGR